MKIEVDRSLSQDEYGESCSAVQYQKEKEKEALRLVNFGRVQRSYREGGGASSARRGGPD